MRCYSVLEMAIDTVGEGPDQGKDTGRVVEGLCVAFKGANVADRRFMSINAKLVTQWMPSPTQSSNQQPVSLKTTVEWSR